MTARKTYSAIEAQIILREENSSPHIFFIVWGEKSGIDATI